MENPISGPLMAPGLPSAELDQSDAYGQVSIESQATEVRDFHQRGLRSRKHRDLTSEKYLLHVDGEGGSQWFDLYYGQRLKIPTSLSGAPRIQNNQLRPIVDNYVSHLSTQPYRFVVETRQDRKSRESSIIDQALINHQARVQRWNMLWSEAKYMAACTGFCPVHAAWRDDQSSDPYEAVLAIGSDGTPMMGPVPGAIDSWGAIPLTTYSTRVRDAAVYTDKAMGGSCLPRWLGRLLVGRNLKAMTVCRVQLHSSASVRSGNNLLVWFMAVAC